MKFFKSFAEICSHLEYSKKLLIHYYDKDGFRILCEFKEKQKTMIKTSNRMEEIYTTAFIIKTDFMIAIEKEMCAQGICDDEFLKGVDPETVDGKKDIANRVNDINKSLKKFLEASKITYRRG